METTKQQLENYRQNAKFGFIIDEIEENEGTYYAYADYTSFGELASAFEGLKIEPTKAELKRIPTTPVEFSEEQMEEIEKMLDKIEDDDDVQAVYTNIA